MSKSFSTASNVAYVLRAMRRGLGWGAVAACAADVALGVALPFLGAALPSFVVGVLASGMPAPAALGLLAAYVAAYQLARVLQAWTANQRSGACSNTRSALYSAYLDALLAADYDYLQTEDARQGKGVAQACFFNGPDSGSQATLTALFDLATNLGGVVVYACVIGWGRPALLAFLVAVSVPAVAATVVLQRRAPARQEAEMRSLEQYDHLIGEALSPRSAKDVKIYRMRGIMSAELDAAAARVRAAWGGEWRDQEVAGLVSVASSLVRDAVAYAVLVAQLFSGAIDLPAFLLLVGMVAGFGTWMGGLFGALALLVQKSAQVGGFRAFQRACEPRPRPVAALPTAGRAHEIAFDHVSFSYDGERSALSDLTLTIRAGEKVALVGPNGAGKTTLVKLACGLIEPTSGRVTIDGVDVRELDRRALFAELAVVFQDPAVLSIPLADNVACAWDAAGGDDGRLVAALSQADLLDKARSLPQGLATYLGQDIDDEGVTLSGGETQRLMLARALYKGAPVVILDEPTAALDPIAEARMYERYDELTEGCTSVFISHRLASTRFCGRVLYLEGGRLAEDGTHDELMAAGGAYARMFETQARYYEDGVQKGQALLHAGEGDGDAR
ncbi:ABC transporter ATP-binding protein [Olsenella uli]|uniref:ABC transporter ATP-binding protein n=1 Tax=Olsenella uli TaxID=133926 RepID=UPI001956520B|nr:ABC transporter ATP-binding protein [Olsenella uli]MBM6816474.1 ABC transporter ATP-binding protein [Olsenella uli]